MANHQTTVLAEREGYVIDYDAMAMAQLARQHGAGRFALDDDIDPLVGMVIETPTGSNVDKNEPLLTFYHTQPLERRRPCRC
ncbi:MAG: hypothetical protein CM15mP78_04100 [Candidatus Poseidoniales archaeon]|nr:MAG: hypothetical protein CM15mP78_04100 [Candidatus Poseidoniales archaeon]